MSKVAKIFAPKVPKQATPAAARVEDPTSPGKQVSPDKVQQDQSRQAANDEKQLRIERDSRLKALRSRSRRRSLLSGSETGERARDTRLG